MTTSVPAAAVDTVLLASNHLRDGATITNFADKTLYLLLGDGTASSSNWTITLEPALGGERGGHYQLPFGFTGLVRGCWATSPTGSAKVTEFS